MIRSVFFKQALSSSPFLFTMILLTSQSSFAMYKSNSFVLKLSQNMFCRSVLPNAVQLLPLMSSPWDQIRARLKENLGDLHSIDARFLPPDVSICSSWFEVKVIRDMASLTQGAFKSTTIIVSGTRVVSKALPYLVHCCAR